MPKSILRKEAPAPKTPEEHREYLQKIVRLKMWFAWEWLKTHPEENIGQVLRNRIDIFRKTEIFDGAMNGDKPPFDNPRWLELEKKITGLYEELGGKGGSERFEEDGLAILKPNLEARAQLDAEKGFEISEQTCGCLRFEKPAETDPHTVAIHIANAKYPGSIFDDRLYIPQCLIDVMEKSAAEHGADRMHCGTWLNSHPRWLELFPREWQDGLSETDGNICWHLGFWGQFITARGTFHEKNAAKFRSGGVMPFGFRTSSCSFANLREHLDSYMKKYRGDI